MSDNISQFKRSLMVELIQRSWTGILNGQLKNFETVCKYNAEMQVEIGTKSEQTECYTLVLFGQNSLISNCCSQLICFQFIKRFARLEVQCLGKDCKFNPLDSVPLDKYFMFACFETKNERKSTPLRAG